MKIHYKTNLDSREADEKVILGSDSCEKIVKKERRISNEELVLDE